MSIGNRSPSALRKPRVRMPLTAGCRAFTLIELLVVVAIIALLLSMLLPSLRGAREQARMTVCGQRLHDFGIGLGTYTAEQQEWLPGINTSGVATMVYDLMISDPTIFDKPHLPVQGFDWMTPLLAMQTELPAVRAERFKFLLDKMRCPSQRYTSAIFTEEGVPSDIEALRKAAPFPTISYLMPAAFQYVGQSHQYTILAYKEHPAVHDRALYAMSADDQWEYINDDYLPALGQIGQPSQKVFVADGTRYFSEDPGAESDLDFDARATVTLFGSFTSQGPWWCGSTEYGVEPGTVNWDGETVSADEDPPGRGRNMALSYRHGSQVGAITTSAQSNPGMINTLMFDGHVERMNDRRSREIALWYPAGTVVQKPSEGMTHAEPGHVIP